MASRGIAVLTRDDARAAPYAAALAPLGYVSVALPVTRTEALDPAPLARAVAGDHDLVLVASARAATALVAAGRPRGRVWAVGPATAAILTAAGIAAELPAVATAEGLARAAIDACSPGRVLVPRAEAGRDDGLALLRAAGWQVDDVVAYRTIATPAGDPALADGLAALASAALCVVFAPSQVAALAALVPLASIRAFAAIGGTTAEALAAGGVEGIVVAREPTPDGLVASLGPILRS